MQRKHILYGVSTAIFLLYTYIQLVHQTLLVGDHGVYFYAAKLWVGGVMPYRDFFFSHSPIQLIPPALVILIAGPNISLLAALPALCGLVSGFVILQMTKESSGWMPAVLALALFLLSYSNLSSSLYFTGQNLALCLLLIGILFFLRGKKCAAGIFFGLSASTGPHMLVLFFMALLLQFSWNKKRIPSLLIGFLSSFGTIHLLFSLFAGSAFWKQTYLYHLQKPDATGYLAGNTQVFSFMFKADFFLVIIAFFSAIYILWTIFVMKHTTKEGGRERLLLLSFCMCGAYLLFLSFMHPIFPHYFLPLSAFAAIIAAHGIYQATQNTRGIIRIVLLFIFASLFFVGIRQVEKKYQTETLIMNFAQAHDVAEHVRALLRPDETLYGDFGIVPLIALLSDRDISAHEVDSSVMRFASGLYELEDTIRAIEEDNVQMVLTRPNTGIASYPPFQTYLRKNFSLMRIFEGKGVSIEEWRRL